MPLSWSSSSPNRTPRTWACAVSGNLAGGFGYTLWKDFFASVGLVVVLSPSSEDATAVHGALRRTQKCTSRLLVSQSNTTARDGSQLIAIATPEHLPLILAKVLGAAPTEIDVSRLLS